MDEDRKQTVSDQRLCTRLSYLIFRLNGYGNVSRLTHRDYEYISHAIETKTATLIGVSTLKKAFARRF